MNVVFNNQRLVIESLVTQHIASSLSSSPIHLPPVPETPSSPSSPTTKMMLVHLPAMDNVRGLSDSLPSFSLPARLASFSHQLSNPSIWLTFLASLVILSSIRAAVLYLRPPPSKAHKIGVSIIPGVGVVQAHQVIASGTVNKGSVNGSLVVQEKREEKQISSMLWGLVKWDSLPALPRGQGVSMSETERGRWQSQPQQRPLKPQRLPGRRPGPAFDHPSTCHWLVRCRRRSLC